MWKHWCFCFVQKWDGFEIKSVTLELHEASIYSRKGKSKNINANNEKDDKIFVAFEIDKIPERIPFLLSRDFASARPSGSEVEPFQVSLPNFHQLIHKDISLFSLEIDDTRHMGIYLPKHSVSWVPTDTISILFINFLVNLSLGRTQYGSSISYYWYLQICPGPST